MTQLADRIAIVTGAGRGIGRKIAQRLAADGADVVVTGPGNDGLDETASAVRASGRRAVTHVMDVTNEEQIAAVFLSAVQTLGRIDILVNNAAIIGPTRAVASISRKDWEDVLAVNLTGAFLCAREALKYMMPERSGKIINIASIAGKLAYPLRSPYAVSKCGLIGLTSTLASECGSYNIQVNAICPGPVRGERMDSIIKSRARILGKTTAEIEDEYIGKTALKRLVEPEDVAAMVAFLAGREADNITGQALDVTAGYMI